MIYILKEWSRKVILNDLTRRSYRESCFPQPCGEELGKLE